MTLADSASTPLWTRLFGRAAPARDPDADTFARARLYAIGDIHGRLDCLDALLARIAEDAGAQPPAADQALVFLGDYIDRGPDSRGVIDRLLAGPPAGFAARYLKGNHEAALLRFLDEPGFMATWRQFGAAETLASYGVAMPPLSAGADAYVKLRDAFAAALPAAHIRFFQNLKLTLRAGRTLFVHAGIRPRIPLSAQAEDDLLSIREPFLSYRGDLGVRVVHGHTPSERATIGANRICVDTGAYATGVLSCAVFDRGPVRILSAAIT